MDPLTIKKMKALAIDVETTSQEKHKPNTLEVNLTYNAINDILFVYNEDGLRGEKPCMLLQILHIVHFPVVEELGKKPHMLLWDGKNAHYALLGVSFSRKYIQEGYRVGSIVRLMRYCCRTLHSKDKIIVVMDMNMVKADAVVIGDPPNVDDIRLPDYYFPRPHPIPPKRRLPPILSGRQSGYGERGVGRKKHKRSWSI